jgi:hypothetical protein
MSITQSEEITYVRGSSKRKTIAVKFQKLYLKSIFPIGTKMLENQNKLRY